MDSGWSLAPGRSADASARRQLSVGLGVDGYGARGVDGYGAQGLGRGGGLVLLCTKQPRGEAAGDTWGWCNARESVDDPDLTRTGSLEYLPRKECEPGLPW